MSERLLKLMNWARYYKVPPVTNKELYDGTTFLQILHMIDHQIEFRFEEGQENKLMYLRDVVDNLDPPMKSPITLEIQRFINNDENYMTDIFSIIVSHVMMVQQFRCQQGQQPQDRSGLSSQPYEQIPFSKIKPNLSLSPIHRYSAEAYNQLRQEQSRGMNSQPIKENNDQFRIPHLSNIDPYEKQKLQQDERSFNQSKRSSQYQQLSSISRQNGNYSRQSKIYNEQQNNTQSKAPSSVQSQIQSFVINEQQYEEEMMVENQFDQEQHQRESVNHPQSQHAQQEQIANKNQQQQYGQEHQFQMVNQNPQQNVNLLPQWMMNQVPQQQEQIVNNPQQMINQNPQQQQEQQEQNVNHLQWMANQVPQQQDYIVNNQQQMVNQQYQYGYQDQFANHPQQMVNHNENLQHYGQQNNQNQQQEQIYMIPLYDQELKEKVIMDLWIKCRQERINFNSELYKQIAFWVTSDEFSSYCDLYYRIVLQFSDGTNQDLNFLLDALRFYCSKYRQALLPREVIDFYTALAPFQVIIDKQIEEEEQMKKDAQDRQQQQSQNSQQNAQQNNQNAYQMTNDQNNQQQQLQNQMQQDAPLFNNYQNNNQVGSVHSSQQSMSSQRIITNSSNILSSDSSRYSQSNQREIANYGSRQSSQIITQNNINMMLSPQQSRSSQSSQSYIHHTTNVINSQHSSQIHNMVNSSIHSAQSQRSISNNFVDRMNSVPQSPQQNPILQNRQLDQRYQTPVELSQGINQQQHPYQISNRRLPTSVQGSQGGSKYFENSWMESQYSDFKSQSDRSDP